jgi:hypothetical protein
LVISIRWGLRKRKEIIRMDSPPIDFVAKRRFALAEERLDEIEADHEARKFPISQLELDAACDEYLVASVAAGEITREELVSDLRMDGLRVPQELLAVT